MRSIPSLSKWITALTLVALGAACSSPPKTPAATGAVADVEIKEFAFSPKSIDVKVGTKVTWTNQDTVLHTVTTGSTDGPENHADGTFNKKLDGKGAKASFVFAQAGTYTYFCSQHNVMNGVIHVS